MQNEPIGKFPINSVDLLEALEGLYTEGEVLTLVLLRRFEEAYALAAKVEMVKEIRQWLEDPEESE